MHLECAARWTALHALKSAPLRDMTVKLICFAKALLLEYVAKERLWEKMGGNIPQVYKDRMNYELMIIKKMGFYDYLLIVKQFMDGARERDVFIGPGRGSGPGSLVCYSLGITQIDPIKYGLTFERWLNYGRAANPLIFDQQMIQQVANMPSIKMPCSHSH